MEILVSGASFAGLSTAYWMRRLGHDVTLVEVRGDLRTGGTAVNLRGNTVDIVRRMGLLGAIQANRLSLDRMAFKNADDHAERTLVMRNPGDPLPDDDLEIERDVLLQLLFEAVRDDVKIVFDDRITALHETEDGVDVSFQKGAGRPFGLVFGCDGTHSSVRKMWFGAEAQYLHSLEQYFCITIVDKLLIERNTAELFNVPGKAVMLNAYRNKTDIILAFHTQRPIPYDYRDEARQRSIIAEQFAGVGWRTPELLREVQGSKSFYFDQLCQIRMPSWTKGRVALVGDAGYCPSPAAGMGGSLAIDGAAALADAMRAHPEDLRRAFQLYNEGFRPFIDQVQAEAVRTGLETLVPRTEAAIRARNAKTGPEF